VITSRLTIELAHFMFPVISALMRKVSTVAMSRQVNVFVSDRFHVRVASTFGTIPLRRFMAPASCLSVSAVDVGYFLAGFRFALFATLGVSAPSLQLSVMIGGPLPAAGVLRGQYVSWATRRPARAVILVSSICGKDWVVGDGEQLLNRWRRAIAAAKISIRSVMSASICSVLFRPLPIVPSLRKSKTSVAVTNGWHGVAEIARGNSPLRLTFSQVGAFRRSLSSTLGRATRDPSYFNVHAMRCGKKSWQETFLAQAGTCAHLTQS